MPEYVCPSASESRPNTVALFTFVRSFPPAHKRAVLRLIRNWNRGLSYWDASYQFNLDLGKTPAEARHAADKGVWRRSQNGARRSGRDLGQMVFDLAEEFDITTDWVILGPETTRETPP
jgi:hypothetical protein